MQNDKLVSQLRLAADLLETGHPWEVWTVGQYEKPDQLTIEQCIQRGHKIRPALATPPDARPLHNPDNLTAEQVGIGYRLMLFGEETNVHVDCQQKWKDGKWTYSGDIFSEAINRTHGAYRLPLSAPWPEAKPDPYAELKRAHAEGKVIQIYHMEGLHESQQFWKDCPNPDWMPHRDYRIKPDSLFQAPPPPPNMRWHSQENWNEYDTPSGYRLLVEGETIQHGDEFYDKGWLKANEDFIFGVGKTIKPIATAFRTRRPLTFSHAGKTWTWHKPGDPMPCDGDKKVIPLVCYEDKYSTGGNMEGSFWNWNDEHLIGWRYAEAEKKTVPLGPEDLIPGSVITGKNGGWAIITSASDDGVGVDARDELVSFEELMEHGKINRSIPLTGKWDPDAWEKCEKEAGKQ